MTSDLGQHCLPRSHKKDAKLTEKHLYLVGVLFGAFGGTHIDL